MFLWFVVNDSRLPPRARLVLRDQANEVFLSAVSIWEACLKHQLGKLPIPGEPASFLAAQREAHGMRPLHLAEACLRYLQGLPPIHKDPFDRMLICHALETDCLLVTDDTAILRYSGATISLSEM